jgi:uncharacterized protein YxjI
MKMEQTERSETLAYKIQTPGNCPEESMQHSEQGESFEIKKISLQIFDVQGTSLFALRDSQVVLVSMMF